MATVKIKNRLDIVTPKVYGWAKDVTFWPTSDPKHDYISQYQNGQAELFEALGHLHDFGMAEAANSLLTAEQSPNTSSIIHMAHGFSRMIHANGIDILELKERKKTIISNLDSVIRKMLGAIALGMPALAKKFHQIVLAGLEQGYGVKNGHKYRGPDSLRYAAMGLSIIHEWLGLPLDLEKFGLPRDPAWGPLVKYWNDPDPVKLQPILYSACDIHIERIALTESEVNSGNFEFGSEFTAVHPTEILAVLRLRQMLDLPSPELDHPLMNTPYAQITAVPEQVTQPDSLLEAFLTKARERDPLVMAEWDQIQVD
ncbi:hypothetical protein L580_3245 [Serratia fonticola AU-P3(3)]|nr:hypothetical protein L580_3245 [Serratia fonticola AU-P3(3)]